MIKYKLALWKNNLISVLSELKCKDKDKEEMIKGKEMWEMNRRY